MTKLEKGCSIKGCDQKGEFITKINHKNFEFGLGFSFSLCQTHKDDIISRVDRHGL